MKNVIQRTPQQATAIEYYRDPKSETFGNLKGSMIRAGFSPSYADMATGAGVAWISETIQRDVARVQRAEEVLDEYLNKAIQLDDPKAVDWARLKVDVAKFVAKNLARGKYTEKESDATPPEVHVNITNYGESKTTKVSISQQPPAPAGSTVPEPVDITEGATSTTL